MGLIHIPPPVKLIVGLLAQDPAWFDRVQGFLQPHYGEVDLASEVWPFDYTDYYTPEMGPNLQRQFLAFERLIDPAELVDVKLFTNDLEAQWAEPREGKLARRFNLDPGYVSLSKLVLATTKDHQHRLYLGRGIYAEVTLRFHRHAFQPWEWTYPDYGSEPYRQWFATVRARYREQLREAGIAP